MSGVEILGLVAGAVTTGSVIPQVMKIFKFKSAGDVSLLFTVLLFAGDGAWLVYGVILRLVPIMIWNVLAMILLAFLFYGKIKYGEKSGRLAPDH